MKRNLLRFVLLSAMSFVTLSASALRGGATIDKNYLCFTAGEADSWVNVYVHGAPAAVTLQMSTDGTTWNEYTLNNRITLANIGDKLYFRNAKTASEVNGFSVSSTDYYNFEIYGSIAASGNVMSLVDKDCATTTIPCDYCFYGLFESCFLLTAAPELPATTLTEGCYMNMFFDCEALTTAPELPATTLANKSYNQMFKDCSQLNDIKVAFTTFNTSKTSMWTQSVPRDGTFSCPANLEPAFNSSKIPYTSTKPWIVKNTYDLTINSESGWASLCVNLPLQVPTGVEVYYASAVEGSTIELTQIAAGTVMAAKTAVIVKGAKGTVGFPIAGEAGTSYKNLFQGSSVAKACNAGENYVLNASKSSDTNVHFSIYTGTTLTDHKAYLPKSAVGGATGSIQFRFGDATAISTVEMESNDDVLYNLAGQHVSDDYRGIVIRNGKKMFNL